MDSHTLNGYQQLSKRTMPTEGSQNDKLANYAMGLAGEAGEVTDLLKKVIYHDHELNRYELLDELGDVLHYLAGIATLLDIPLENVAMRNIAKLKNRYPDGFNSIDSINREG